MGFSLHLHLKRSISNNQHLNYAFHLLIRVLTICHLQKPLTLHELDLTEQVFKIIKERYPLSAA
jgi:hypothetical protein